MSQMSSRSLETPPNPIRKQNKSDKVKPALKAIPFISENNLKPVILVEQILPTEENQKTEKSENRIR